MVTDHSKANDELKQLATTKGLALPHEKDVKEFEKASKNGKDAEKVKCGGALKCAVTRPSTSH